ncbi:MAG: ABC transporter permease, partial [Chloroflexota bacterium]
FFPIGMLPVFLQPLAYALPLTYGVDVLRGAFGGSMLLAPALDFVVLSAFCVVLFLMSLRNIRRRWIL